MRIQDVIQLLENTAPQMLQEGYDNSGLLTGNPGWDCKGILVTLDATEEVVKEAIEKKCNLVIAHHPIIFGGLKKITGKTYVERTIIMAIKNDIAIYAIHTNLDNVIAGVNGKIADILGLKNRTILASKSGLLKKLVVFVPEPHSEKVRNAIFASGGGHIGNYSECSFNTQGEGTFNAGKSANPYVGQQGQLHFEKEIKMEMVFQAWLEAPIVKAMQEAHPYEEVAYDIINIENQLATVGSGLVGELESPVTEAEFLQLLKKAFQLQVVKHTSLTGRMVSKVALCGGAGSFLIRTAIVSGADFFVSSDIKYHEFFDAENHLVIADIGHYESEQYTISLLFDILKKKYPTFAVLKTEINTNPVQYFL